MGKKSNIKWKEDVVRGFRELKLGSHYKETVLSTMYPAIMLWWLTLPSQISTPAAESIKA